MTRWIKSPIFFYQRYQLNMTLEVVWFEITLDWWVDCIFFRFSYFYFKSWFEFNFFVLIFKVLIKKKQDKFKNWQLVKKSAYFVLILMSQSFFLNFMRIEQMLLYTTCQCTIAKIVANSNSEKIVDSSRHAKT